MLITFSKVKKKAKNKKKGTNLPFRSLRNRSFGFVRSSGLQSLKKKGKRTLITFSKVKKKTKMEEKKRTYLFFVQEPFVRLPPFVQAPFLREKERAYLFVRSGTVRSASSVRLSSIPKKKRKRTLITLLRSKNK